MRRGVLLALLLLLAACQPGDPGQALQDDYLARLANGLELDLAAAPPASLEQWRMPPRRERLLATPELRIGLLDLLIDMHRCPRLQQLIAERNNSLGKQMVASRRLGYEGQLIAALQDCLPVLARPADAATRDTLQALLAAKREQLPAVFWNAVNAGPEVEQYLRFAPRALAPEAPGDEAALLALERLAEIGTRLPAALPPAPEALDELFFALHASSGGPELITSLQRLTATLEAGSKLLERRQATRPLCPQGRPTPRGRLMQNLFVKYYAGQLQPYLATVHQRGQRWSAALRRLAGAPGIPSASRDYLLALAGTEHSLWSGLNAASQRHVQAWQDSLRRCQLAPGQSGWDASRR